MIEHQDNEAINNQQDSSLYLSPLAILLFLSLLILIGMLLGSGLSYIIGKSFGYSLRDIMDTLSPESGIEKRNFIRISLLANHCVLFVLPPFVLAYALLKKRWYKFLAWRALPFESLLMNTVVGSIMLLVSMPLVQYVYHWNQQLPIPEWARMIDNNTTETIKNLLLTEAFWELPFNILVVAIIPAIGEEMVFRGVIQRQFKKWFTNPHLSIWFAAMLFSAFHVQLEGFFPRMLLGALLGYLYYWSKSLWIPILIHFLNNGLQVLVIYYFAQDLSNINLEKTTTIPIWGALLSLLLLLAISRVLISYNQAQMQPFNRIKTK